MKVICIYKITNKINNKIYIGSSNNFRNRWKNHTNSLNRNVHENDHLQKAWNKYGKDNFEFNIILLCEEFELLKYEQWYLDNVIRFGIDYNIAKFAGAPMRGAVFTKEHRKKLSEARIGKTLSKETKHKMSVSRIGNKNPMYGKTRSDGVKKSIRDANKKLSIEQVREIHKIHNNKTITHNKLGEIFNTSRENITNILNGNRWKDVYKEVYDGHK